MRHARLLGLVLFVIAFATFGSTAFAAEPFRYPEGKLPGAELKYYGNLPVLTVSGKPEEIGHQIGMLALKPAKRLPQYPRDCLRMLQLDFAWGHIVSIGRSMLPQFPPDHLAELEAMSKTLPNERDLLIAGNTLFDIKKFFGCSTLWIDAQHSATGSPLLGRNLDFPTLGYLQDYTLVTVYQPTGKRAWASIGFPGCVGCLSGMNDAGLTVAVLEVGSSRDGAARFNSRGMPYALCFRRLLEECETIDEAAKLLETMPRTTLVNLAICDRKDGAVLEITPKQVAIRRANGGTQPCTNHFRTSDLAKDTSCYRYDALCRADLYRKVGLKEMQGLLHSANQGSITLQTMVFEPTRLQLHLAIGPCPTSRQPMHTLDLQPLLKPPVTARAAAATNQ